MAEQLVESLAGDFEPERVPRRLPRAGARPDRAEGGRRGVRGARAPRPRRRRSSTSWPRSRPACKAAKDARGRHPATVKPASVKAGRRPSGRRAAAATAVADEDEDEERRPARSRPAPGPASRPSRRSRPLAAAPKQLVDGRRPASSRSATSTRCSTRRRVHQGRGHRLLRPHRAGDAAPPRRPGAHLQALPQRRRARRASSRSAARSTGPTWVPTRARARRPQRRHRLLRVRRAGRAGVGGQHGRARAARADGARRRPRHAADGRVRPRPGPPAAIAECCRDRPRRSATSSPRSTSRAGRKTSGSKGLQLYVPLNTPVHPRAGRPTFALAVGQLLERQRPERGADRRWPRPSAPGKVFVDWSQNARHKTTIAVVLAAGPPATRRCRRRSRGTRWPRRPRATTSCASSWTDVLDRVEEIGDLFAPVLTTEQRLPAAAG